MYTFFTAMLDLSHKYFASEFTNKPSCASLPVQSCLQNLQVLLQEGWVQMPSRQHHAKIDYISFTLDQNFDHNLYVLITMTTIEVI